MSFDKQSLGAIGLCIVFYIIYSQYLAEKYPNYGKTKEASESQSTKPSELLNEGERRKTEQAAELGVSEGNADVEQIPLLSEESLTISSDVATFQFSQASGGLDAVRLLRFREELGGSESVNLIDKGGLAIQGTVENPLASNTLKPSARTYHAVRTHRKLTFSKETSGWRIEQEYVVPESGYLLDVNLTFKNLGSAARDLLAGVRMNERIKFAEMSSGFIPGAPTARPTYSFSLGGKGDYEDIEEYCKDPNAAPVADAKTSGVDYFGLDKHYFLSVLLPQDKHFSFTMNKVGQVGDDAESCQVAVLGYQDYGQVGAGEAITLGFKGYFGPKQIEVMDQYNPFLSNSLDLGIFDFIAKILMAVIHTFHQWTGNYGVAIVILTLLLKVLFYPLMKASSVSMHRMKKLNPEMQRIREKHKDDRQKQQMEIMGFMKKHKVNPMKGCLPILPQIPVFFAFFQVLRTSIDLRHAPFFGWIQDLSVMDPYFVTPVLMGAAMFVQQKLTPTTGMDKTQEKIMMFMPIMFTFFMVTLPAGMTVYMLVNTVVSIGQQKWLYYSLDKKESK